MKIVSRQATNKLLEMVEQGLLDRDNVIMACIKYMSEDDVADMMRINEFESEPDFDQFDDSEYDVEAMKTDYDNGNFNPERDNSEPYRVENIVEESFRNGQFTQAKEQCERYDLDYDTESAKWFGQRTPEDCLP